MSKTSRRAVFPPIPTLTARDESYSQWGEDRQVLEFFGGLAHGVFLEAGAHHPIRGSQTNLLENHGWTGVLVEPSPDNEAGFKSLRPRSRLVRAALGAPETEGRDMAFLIPLSLAAEARLLAVGEIPGPDDRVITTKLTTLTRVLIEAGVQNLDFLSLDLEGHELPALCGLDFKRWRPALIMIEDHLHKLDKHWHLRSRGYRLVFRTGSNNWYVPAGTIFVRLTLRVRLELFRKLYLSLPLRKLRIAIKRLRGLRP